MKKNIGKTDKTVRIILGMLIGVAGLYFQSWWGLLGLIPLLTAFMGTCGLYLPFGISTCSTKTE
ncbi:MAG: YgaP family membrane protein [Bacteroidota bacterium]